MSDKPARAIKLDVINEPKIPTQVVSLLSVQVVVTTKFPA